MQRLANSSSELGIWWASELTFSESPHDLRQHIGPHVERGALLGFERMAGVVLGGDGGAGVVQYGADMLFGDGQAHHAGGDELAEVVRADVVQAGLGQHIVQRVVGAVLPMGQAPAAPRLVRTGEGNR